MENNRLLTIIFKQEIRRRDIPQFRGAVINSLDKSNVLFHNHIGDDAFRYSYPLIQYKTINRHAAIVCLGQGTEAIGDFFTSSHDELHISDETISLEVDNIKADIIKPVITNEPLFYNIHQWLPLNQKNYPSFKSLESEVEKCEFLEKILTANILSFLKGMSIFIDSPIETKILRIKEKRITWFKDIRVKPLDIFFKSNILLPDNIGLGKGVSIGFGTLFKKRSWSKDNSEDTIINSNN